MSQKARSAYGVRRTGEREEENSENKSRRDSRRLLSSFCPRLNIHSVLNSASAPQMSAFANISRCRRALWGFGRSHRGAAAPCAAPVPLRVPLHVRLFCCVNPHLRSGRLVSSFQLAGRNHVRSLQQTSCRSSFSLHLYHPPLVSLPSFSLLSLTRCLLTSFIADIFLFRSPHFSLPLSFDIPGTSFSLHTFIPTFLSSLIHHFGIPSLSLIFSFHPSTCIDHVPSSSLPETFSSP